MINKIEKVSSQNLFSFDSDKRTRKHSHHLKIKHHVNKNTSLNFFTRRVIKNWNSLPQNLVSCKSLKEFKKGLDIFLETHYNE